MIYFASFTCKSGRNSGGTVCIVTVNYLDNFSEVMSITDSVALRLAALGTNTALDYLKDRSRVVCLEF